MKRITYLFVCFTIFMTSCSKEDTGNGVVEATITMQRSEGSAIEPDPSALTFLVPNSGKAIDMEESNLKTGQIWFKGDSKITNFSRPGFADQKGVARIENVTNGKYILIVRSITMYSTTYTDLEVKDNSVVLKKTFKKYDSQNESW
ncbi:hypothetical protein ACR79N_02170 [Sphingobacterium siyangense]|uniref:hypothetical protein n=1 Tax=Sphingobacterium siyangense TaxID=459529 RepID=UPI003DA3485D